MKKIVCEITIPDAPPERGESVTIAYIDTDPGGRTTASVRVRQRHQAVGNPENVWNVDMTGRDTTICASYAVALTRALLETATILSVLACTAEEVAS